MELIDISVGVSGELPVWPGDPPIVLERTASMDAGDVANLSRLSAGVHLGTHVDAPLHFVAGGTPVEALPLAVLIGPAVVVDMPHARVIDAASLDAAAIPEDAQRLLFQTSNGRLWDEPGFQEEYVAVEESGARWLVDRGVRLVGVDYLSVAPFSEPVPTHQILLESGVVIVEGLDLRSVAAGRYTLYCLPVKLLGSDGAPARALLSKSE